MKKSRGTHASSDGLRWINHGAVGIGQVAYAPMANLGGLTTQSISVDVLRAYYFSPDCDVTLSAIMSEVTTLAAAGVYRIGIYAPVAAERTLYPGPLLFDSAELTSDSAALDVVACTQRFMRGRRYFFAHHAGVLAATFRTMGGSMVLPNQGLRSTAPSTLVRGIAIARAYAALPDPFPAGASEENTVTCPVLFRPG